MTFLVSLVLGLLMAALALAQPVLSLPENARIIAMGGAYTALADDPQAGLWNPAGLRGMKQVAADLSYTVTAPHRRSDFLHLALMNPGTEMGTAFVLGIYTQDILDRPGVSYYIPYAGTGWQVTGSTHLGLVTRYGYRHSTLDSVSSKWLTIGDLSLRQQFQTIQLAAAVEKLVGGGADIPRRLRWGAALVIPEGINISYEWRGDAGTDNFKFHYTSSHVGTEVKVGDYACLRSGYVWRDFHFLAVGAAIGTLEAGWRFDLGWEFPAAGNGDTRWGVNMGYRI